MRSRLQLLGRGESGDVELSSPGPPLDFEDGIEIARKRCADEYFVRYYSFLK